MSCVRRERSKALSRTREGKPGFAERSRERRASETGVGNYTKCGGKLYSIFSATEAFGRKQLSMDIRISVYKKRYIKSLENEIPLPSHGNSNPTSQDRRNMLDTTQRKAT